LRSSPTHDALRIAPDCAHQLRTKVQSIAPIRATLIAKGMIYSPSHGDTGFTVPLFDQYMRRVIP